MAAYHNIGLQIRNYLVDENLVQEPVAVTATPTLPECYVDPPRGLGEPTATRPLLAAVYLNGMPPLPAYAGCWRRYTVNVTVKSLAETDQQLTDLLELHENIRLRFSDYEERFNLTADGMPILEVRPLTPLAKATYSSEPARKYHEYYAEYNFLVDTKTVNDL